jgi:hypothetical protein
MLILHCYSDGKAFKTLVDSMIDQDLAMRSVVQNAELLLFTSTVLPMPYKSEPSCLYSFIEYQFNLIFCIKLNYFLNELICSISGEVLFMGGV